MKLDNQNQKAYLESNQSQVAESNTGHGIPLEQKARLLKRKKYNLNLWRLRNGQLKNPISFTRLIPNFLTILGLAVGISSARFALDERWDLAVTCIIIAALIDGLDGRIARILKATSIFGAELDSLCDFVNFGVSPAILIYLWSFQQYEFKLISWAAVLLYIICSAIRLARFNTSIYQEHKEKLAKYFFTGVPMPAGAMLAIIPIILDFEISTALKINIRSHTILIDMYLATIGLLMASTLPTVAFKNLEIKPEYVWVLMIIIAVFTINLIIYPWYFLPVLAVIYISTIPLSVILAKKITNR